MAWWDEPVEFLTRLVGSLAGVADALVAFDGRWAEMPGERDLSGVEQSDAIHGVAGKVGIVSEVWAGAPLDWGSQVEKRDALMRRAGELGDWVLVVDGDEFVQARGDLHGALAAAPADAMSGLVTLIAMNRPRPWSHLAPMASTQARLFRSGVTVPGPAHNDYALDGVPVRDLPKVNLSNSVTVWHDNNARPDERREAAQAYRRARRELALEIA